MNELIQKIKESACPKIDWEARHYVELNNGEKERWQNEWFDKFAELLVKECASKVDNILREKKDGGGTMGDEIREHFGVRE